MCVVLRDDRRVLSAADDHDSHLRSYLSHISSYRARRGHVQAVDGNCDGERPVHIADAVDDECRDGATSRQLRAGSVPDSSVRRQFVTERRRDVQRSNSDQLVARQRRVGEAQSGVLGVRVGACNSSTIGHVHQQDARR